MNILRKSVIGHNKLRRMITMIKVLFICHGNICRSPMAEFLFKEMVEEKGMSQLFEIDSAATSSEEIWNGIGNPVYPPVKDLLKKRGIDCSGKRARQVNWDDYHHYDYLICMDQQNYKNLMNLFKKDPDHKISLLLNRQDIEDPWYSGNFEGVYQQIEHGLQVWLEKLTTEA